MSELQVAIRKLHPEEWPVYRELRLESLRLEPQAFGASYETNLAHPDSWWQERLENVLNGEGNQLLFADVSGAIVGIIGAIPRREERTADVISMYVTPRWRGRGISRRLMEELLRQLSLDPDLEMARLTVNRAQIAAVTLYRSSGFEVEEEARSEMGDGKCYDEYVMTKPLRSGPGSGSPLRG